MRDKDVEVVVTGGIVKEFCLIFFIFFKPTLMRGDIEWNQKQSDQHTIIRTALTEAALCNLMFNIFIQRFA